MQVYLTVHGGQRGLEEVISGLVARNERSIREGKIPATIPKGLHYREDHIWRDGLGCLINGRWASAGTVAAWQAAGERARGNNTATVGFIEGVPRAVTIQNNRVVGLPDLTAGFGRTDGVGIIGDRIGATEGRVQERMLLTLDDDMAAPVAEINTAIAYHNARRMKELGPTKIPPIYQSGVVYRIEGAPELWWDAEEIVAQGFDDCEGLAAYRAGELIQNGYDAGVAVRRIDAHMVGKPGRSGGGRQYHAITRVDMPDGRVLYDDPSMRLGMPCPAAYIEWADKRRKQGLPL